ncbi:AraC family transcriptional regulator [Leeuwenhoekiella marinoflava]|uniref:AraC family transcriptional regulator n=1 Tax=Leeuwenhoekiella marinoflava TaxID=988 RepID=UPI003001F0E5
MLKFFTTQDGEIPTLLKKYDIHLKTGASHELIAEGTKQETSYRDQNHIERITKLKQNTLKLHIKESILNSLKITEINFHALEKKNLLFTGLQEAVQMIFLLEGSCELLFESCSYTLQPQTHNILNRVEQDAITLLNEGTTTFLIIEFEKNLLYQLLPHTKHVLEFINRIDDNAIGLLNTSNGSLVPSMKLIIDDIINFSKDKNYQKLYLQTKAMELLLIQLEVLEENIRESSTNSSDKQQQMNEVREYVTKHYKNPGTLKNLAKKIGTNEFELKKQFKASFGTTVFGYIADVKMNKAKDYLKNSSMSISQIAEAIGYKNPQHFSTAFKKKFGFSPSKIRE